MAACVISIWRGDNPPDPRGGVWGEGGECGGQLAKAASYLETASLKACTHIACDLLVGALRLDFRMSGNDLQQKSQHAEYCTCNLLITLFSIQYS